MHSSTYDTIWQEFLLGDHISQAAFWGAGLALVIPIQREEILARIRSLQELLAARLPFYPHPPEALHITITVFGSPVAEKQAQLRERLRESLHSIPAFTVDLRRVNSFFRAPFLETHAAGHFEDLSGRVQPILAENGLPQIDYGPRGQVWHLTLGAYSESNDGAAARAALSELRGWSAGCLRVDQLCLVETLTGRLFRMETIENYSLSSGSQECC